MGAVQESQYTSQIKPGIANREPILGGDDQVSWVFPSGEVGTSSGSSSTTPLPFNPQVSWSLAPGA